MSNAPAMDTQQRKFLICSLNDALYAFDLAQIAEVGDLPLISPIPHAPAYYSGVINFHGDIVAVLHLAHFLDLPGSGTPGKLVVLNQRVASLAFLVDSVVRILSESEVLSGEPPGNSFATARLSLPDGEALLLDLDALVYGAEMGMRGEE